MFFIYKKLIEMNTGFVNPNGLNGAGNLLIHVFDISNNEFQLPKESCTFFFHKNQVQLSMYIQVKGLKILFSLSFSHLSQLIESASCF